MFFIGSEGQAQRIQKQQEQEEYRQKNFIAFKKPEGTSVVDYMESLLEKDLFTENYLLLMRTLGQPIPAAIASCRKAVPNFPDNIIGEVLECGCGCHELTLLCVMRNPKLRYVFGFVDWYHDGTYYHTVAHSFLLSECRKLLFDMKLQFEIMEPGIRSTDEQEVEKLTVKARNYFGIEIPFSIIAEIWHAREKRKHSTEYANPYRFIKNNVFTSRETTLQFIKRIQKLQGTLASYEKIRSHSK